MCTQVQPNLILIATAEKVYTEGQPYRLNMPLQCPPYLEAFR